MPFEATYIHSQLSASAAGRLVEAHYPLSGPIRSLFYVSGLHDNYLIEQDGVRYILRVYRNDWRTAEEVNFELELLAFLNERNALVACPVSTIAGKLHFYIQSPEGERIAALFHFAIGDALDTGLSPDVCILLGRAVAQVHQAADTFTTKYQRPHLDAQHLLDESIEMIKPFVDGDNHSYLVQLHKRLRNTWPALPKQSGTFGICTGDVNAKNFHIDVNRKITLFDFDQCGYGFRAFEIGKFSSSLVMSGMKQTLLNAFLAGYQEVRSLSDAEIEAIPYFEIIAIIWVMAIHAKNANRIGYQFLEKPFWDKKVALLKTLYN